MSECSVGEAKAEAERLLSAGEYGEALSILKEVLEKNPPTKDLYQDIIYLYLSGEAYTEAKELSQRYEHVFGEKPPTELSAPSIDAQRRQYWETLNRHSSRGEAIFKRLSFFEKGGKHGATATWSGRAWREVHIYPDHIVLKKWWRTYSLEWDEVKEARLEKREATGSWANNVVKYVQKVIVLNTRERTFEIDVSTKFPEFENPSALEQMVSEHVGLED